MRIAVIGVGSIGRLHAQLLAEVPAIDSVIVADVDTARADALAAELGGRALPTSEAIVVADAVVIATPAEVHRPPFEEALDSGRPVLCEKPLGSDLAETVAMAERAAADGAVVQLGFQRRFDRGFAAARDAVAAGRLGELHLVRLTARDPRPVDAARLASARSPDAAPLFRDSSIHDFDLARFLTGDEVVDVDADGADRHGRRHPDPARLETAAVTMRTRRGVVAVLDATLLDPRGYDVRAELVGSADSLSAGLGPRTPLPAVDGDGTRPNGAPWPGYLERFRDAYRAELAAFVALVRDGGTPVADVRDGLEAMRIAVAATRSYVEGRRVALDEIPASSGMSHARGVA
jgi:myo-inositol 2-dehydrogenase / D-chiro-inositol 1-dehydrogenase